MISGFMLSAYSIVANDAIQTLGTFLSSNNKQPWGCIPLWQPGKYGLTSRPIEVLNFKPLPNEYNYSMSKLGCSQSEELDEIFVE